MINIKLNDVQKKYGDNIIIPNINIDIEAGQRIVLLGPSGCGKSTLLRMIAGLEEVSSGTIMMDERDVTKEEPGDRDVAMVFQNYALYPHLSVEENITYALKVNKVPSKEIIERLEYVLDALSLRQYRNRKPHELSGGQRQRVALARATVKRSKAFLLDEPLSNLDVQLRVSARQSMLDIHQSFHQTMVYVTHDQIEAMTFASKIILLNHGEVQMYDTPYNVYHYPRNLFTASFIGTPAMNLINEIIVTNRGATFNQQILPIGEQWINHLDSKKQYVLGIRPEYLTINKNKTSQTYFEGVVDHIENQGSNYAIYMNVLNQKLVCISEKVNVKKGEHIYLELPQEHLHFFDLETTLNVGRPECFVHQSGVE